METTQKYYFRNIEQIKKLNEAIGHNWFRADTMRFFSSEVLPTIYGGKYFISSEEDTYGNYARKFTIRIAKANGDIDTVGSFQAYDTEAEAIEAVTEMVMGAKWETSSPTTKKGYSFSEWCSHTGSVYG